MYSSEKIRNAEIKKSALGGYNMDSVDDLLDEVADDFARLEKIAADSEAKAIALNEKLEEYRASESSIHTAILNAQRIADQTVKEASEAAGHTAADSAKKAETLISDAEEKAASIVSEAEEKANIIVADAIAKTESIIAAAHDSVARQQALFDKLKVETKELRDELLQKYKRQISFVESLPDEVPFDAERAAEVMAFAFDNVPDYDAWAASVKPSTGGTGYIEEPAPAADAPAETAEAPQESPDLMPAFFPELEEETDDGVDYAAILAEAVARDEENDGGFVVKDDADDGE